MSFTEDGFVAYVVYKNPLDYPDQFVVRRWLDLNPDPVPVAVTPDLEAARDAIPPFWVNIGRYIQDDPAILEVWV